MKNCKNFKIYKFKFIIKGKSTKSIKNRWDRAQELTQFKVNIINSFAKENFIELKKYTFFSENDRILYEKEWLTSPFEIGFDMIEKQYGMVTNIINDILYISIPKSQTSLIDFFDSNIPNWVTVVKKI